MKSSAPRLRKNFVIFCCWWYFLLLNSACEGYRVADGVVQDAKTNLPLSGVLVKVDTGSGEMITDSTGTFEVHNNIGGCVFGCKDIVVSFSKDGYSKQTLKNPAPGTVVLLEK